MTDMLKTFKEFLEDDNAGEMYITGVAGTGKTTELKTLVDHCMRWGVTSRTCAYTHKAVGVLASKLSRPTEKNSLSTLHSYLKKCPTVDVDAVEVQYVEGNSQVSLPDHVEVLFVDEFSMIGRKDHDSIKELQYDDGFLVTKVVYIGDPNQLPPVKDEQVVYPKGDYCVHLTKIHRQANDNPLIDALIYLNDLINDVGEAKPLPESASLKRNTDIVKLYEKCKTSKILLVYTNARVQGLNAEVQGYTKPMLHDMLFSPTIREHFELVEAHKQVDHIVTIRREVLELESKYKTLETLHEIEGVEFFTLQDADGNQTQRAVVFGHDDFLQLTQSLAHDAVAVNQEIERRFGLDSKDWAKVNWSHELAKKRSKAWKRFLSFKDNVLCVDFPHAMTVHKSQGSTYENVFIDMDDLGKCANRDYKMYLRLLYVAISRASERVYTN